MTPQPTAPPRLPERVSNVKQSPLNPRLWNLSLSCGHDLWMTAKGKPRRRLAHCPRCAALALGAV